MAYILVLLSMSIPNSALRYSIRTPLTMACLNKSANADVP